MVENKSKEESESFKVKWWVCIEFNWNSKHIQVQNFIEFNTFLVFWVIVCHRISWNSNYFQHFPFISEATKIELKIFSILSILNFDISNKPRIQIIGISCFPHKQRLSKGTYGLSNIMNVWVSACCWFDRCVKTCMLLFHPKAHLNRLLELFIWVELLD